MDAKQITTELNHLSSMCVDEVVRQLNEKTCAVSIDDLTANVDIDDLHFCFWIANDKDSLKCYEGEHNTIDLIIDDSNRDVLWDAIREYSNKRKQMPTKFEPKKKED